MVQSFDLERFVQAQSRVYDSVLSELRAGEKQTHWMWFVFPQIAGLGSSPTAMHYAIRSRTEAEAFLKHPVLGKRLRECTHLVNSIDGRSIGDIFGYPDNLKFRSCMTLFANVTSDNRVFLDALEKYFGGAQDELTLERL